MAQVEGLCSSQASPDQQKFDRQAPHEPAHIESFLWNVDCSVVKKLLGSISGSEVYCRRTRGLRREVLDCLCRARPVEF